MRPLQADDPRRVGAYRLLGRLGAGGMGVVYLGRSPGGRTVAVKRVREGFARDARFRARFQREVAAARTVTGLYTAPLLDADPQDAVPWLVTDYLPGLSLREAVALFGALPTPAVRLLAAALAEALADIHRAGLAHRDLKPENIMLTAEGPRVIDFGIARPEDASQITLPGVPLGTPGFMAPEQASGLRTGPAGDVFALGSVLVFAATGQEPFAAQDRAATLARVRQARVDLGALPDRRLRAFAAACLRREPGQRPSAAALLDRLGEPSGSVQGTGWLPAPLAEAIDRRGAAATGTAVPPAAPAAAVAAGGLPEPMAFAGQSTADPAQATDDPIRPPADLARPGRRRLFTTVAAVPVAAGAALGLARLVSAAGDRPDPAHRPSASRPATASPKAPAPPPQGVEQWKVKLSAKSKAVPDLYSVGGVVIAADADVRALDQRSGKVLWSRAAAMDTVTAGTDAVYVADPLGGDVSVVRALHPASGATRWSYRIPFNDFVWGMAATGSVVCISCNGLGHVAALGAQDGKVRWTTDVKALQTVIAAAGRVVACADEAVLASLDARSGRRQWTRTAKGATVTAAIGEDMVFVRDQHGTLYAYRAADGTPAWEMPLDYRTTVRRPGHGLVYVDDVDGTIRAFRAGTGRPVWSRQLGQNDQSTLGLSDGTLWVACGGTDGVRTLYALDVSDGRTLWTCASDANAGTTTGIEMHSKAVTAAGLVVLGTWDGHVQAVSPPSPSRGRRQSTGGGRRAAA